MHPGFQYDMTQARHQDHLRSAARRRPAAQARAARRARVDGATAAPPGRVLRLLSRLLSGVSIQPGKPRRAPPLK